MADGPSDDFEKAFTDSGAPSRRCGYCGVTHFCTGYDDVNGELRTAAKLAPDEYVEHQWDGISFGTIEGIPYVPDCTCKQSLERATMIESFLLGHKDAIIRYFQIRAESLSREGAQLAEQVETVGDGT